MMAGLQRRWSQWLTTAAVDATHNLCVSWRDPTGQVPGYLYEEATAWALLIPAFAKTHREVASALRSISIQRGLARDGRTYLFDTGVGLAAALALDDDAWAHRLLESIKPMIGARVGVSGGPRLGAEEESTRWSESFGSHLLWLLGPLDSAGRSDLGDMLVDELLRPCSRGNTLAVHAGTDRVYAHAMAYAVEGLATRKRHQALARSLTTSLLDHVRDGVVHAGLNSGPARLDVTAQTLRLAAVLGLADRDETEALMASLAEHTHASGGLRYEPGSDHINTWATVFALRAARPDWKSLTER